MLERLFHLSQNKTTWRSEAVGGLTTFVTMAYIIFVQPLVLAAAGMDAGAVMVATCLSSAIGCLCMAFLANYPIALAPGMGANVFFSYTVVLSMGFPWETAMGAIFLAGSLFVLLSFFGFREAIINALPSSMRSSIAVGIGLMISVVGLEWAGIVVDDPVTLVALGDLTAPPVLLSLAGLIVMVSILARGFKSAILIGILVGLTLSILTGLTSFEGFVGPIPSLSPSAFRLDILGALQPEMITVVFIFFFLDLFDTVGTLTGVTQEAGFLEPDGSLPRARWALLSDAIATVFGSLLGTSTVTSYVESAAGIGSGARTGLANIITALMFLLALFFSPLLRMISGGMESDGLRLYPIIAPALIVVGCYLIRGVRRISWEDYTEAFPAFLTIIVMPLTFSITEGISFGFIAYTILKTVSGRFREVPTLVVFFTVLFLVRYLVV